MSDDNAHSKSRLNEIIKVLRRYNIAKGLNPVKLRHILEDLGPTYAKLGQIMSMRSDMLPEAYCKELSKLQAEIKPLPYSDILLIIEKELGGAFSNYFLTIDETPVGSASIAQVHCAILKNGEKVVLKVQRPGIRKIMEEDIKMMKKAVGLMKFAVGTGDLIDFNGFIDELWKITKEEIDFIKEAKNYKRFAENHKDIAYVTCPVILDSFSTDKLIVMTYLEGIPIDHNEELVLNGYDLTEIGQKAAESYCKQILDDGFFHADPHPGNIWVGDGKIIWLDMGMMGCLSSDIKSLMKKAVLAILKNDIYELEKVILALGETKKRINHAQLYSDIEEIVNKYLSRNLGNMKLGELIECLLDLVRTHNISIPTDITLLGRGIITMESVLTICSPSVNFLEILTNHVSSSIMEHMDIKGKLRHGGRDLYNLSKEGFAIPLQLSELLKLAKTGHLKINLDINEAEKPLKTALFIAHHFVLGIIDAALFIVSGLLCIANIKPYIYNIPVIAVWGFAISFLLLLYLIIRIKQKI